MLLEKSFLNHYFSDSSDDCRLHLAKDIARYLRLAGGTLPYPPIPAWGKGITFKDVLQGWDSVCDRILSRENNDKIGIYAHVPFCVTKCFYCNLISFSEHSDEQHSIYLDCLEKEIRLIDFPKQVEIKTVYVGGGTPTILSVNNLERLFRMLYGHFNLGACEQIMIEISSHTGSFEKIKLLKDFGVNKVTMGVQTLDAGLLRNLNRPQNKSRVALAYEFARKTGIKYINIDLMAGLPGQTVDSFIASLKEILKMRPDTIHINPFMPDMLTNFYSSNGRLKTSDLRRRFEMVRLGSQIIGQELPCAIEKDELEKENMQLYNSKTLNSSVLGIGYGAISHANQKLHYGKVIDYKSYLERLRKSKFPGLFGCRLDKEMEMRAYLIANLESNGFVSTELFRKLFGRELKKIFKNEINYLAQKGKLREEGSFLRPVFDNKAERFIYSKIFYDKKVSGRLKRLAGSRPKKYDNFDFDPLFFYA